MFSLGKKAAAEDVVRLGLEAFRANQASVIHGTGNYVTALLSRFTTRELTAKLTAKLMRPRPPQLVAGARAVQP